MTSSSLVVVQSKALCQLSAPFSSPFLRQWILAGNTIQASTVKAPRARSAISRGHACVAAWDPLTEQRHSGLERGGRECGCARDFSPKLLAVGGEGCGLGLTGTPTPPHSGCLGMVASRVGWGGEVCGCGCGCGCGSACVSQRQVTTCRTCAPVAVSAVAAARWPGAAAGAATTVTVLPYPSVRMVFGWGCAGWLGGRAAQPGSTCTASPACGSGKHRSWLNRGAAALHPLGRRRWQRRPQAIRVLPRIRARPSNCSESPEGQTV